MIKGAIFDLDGTLLDSMAIWDTIGEDYLHSLGLEPKEDLKETFKNFSMHQSAKYYQNNYGVNLSVDEIIGGVNKLIENYYINEVSLKPHVIGFLQQLEARKVKMCVATVTDGRLAEAALKRCGAYGYFSEIFTCADTGGSKETPYIYRNALAHLGTHKNETVVFEDTLMALQTAKQDGFITAAVYDEHEERQKEIKEFADFYLTDYRKFENFWKFASSF